VARTVEGSAFRAGEVPIPARHLLIQSGREPMLKVNNIEVIYSDVILVLKGCRWSSRTGRSSRCWAPTGGEEHHPQGDLGLLKSEEGEVTDGEILFGGEKINGKDPRDRQKGVFQVMEGRKVFEDLTTEENLPLRRPHPERPEERQG